MATAYRTGSSRIGLGWVVGMAAVLWGFVGAAVYLIVSAV